MKTLGIIGGLGPESTIEYYRFLLDRHRMRAPYESAPHLLIDSLDVNRGIAMLDANDLPGLTNYIAASVERLARAGAEIALIAANTPHLVFEEIEKRAPIPMISIVRAACDRAQHLKLKRLGLIGTGFTMRARFYFDVFESAGIELVVPEEAERILIHQKYISELLKNEFRPESRATILQIIARLQSQERIEALLLAGTELPLLLRGTEPAGLPFLDTTLIHVEAAIEAILA
jgi:aspartate racemase